MSRHQIHKLQEQKILNSIIIEGEQYYRLQAPVEFIIGDTLVSQIKAEYEAGIEKGGLIFFKPQKVQDTTKLVAIEVVLIDNISPTPERSYLGHRQALYAAMNRCLSSQLLPLSFHTHPTLSTNIINESYMYLQQLNTSQADQIASLWSMCFGDMKLRLPDILIVGSGSHKIDLFIGFYNGLICSPTFKEHKEHLMSESVGRVVDWIEENTQTPKQKVIAGLAAVAAVGLFAKYPKIAFPLLISAGVIVPQLIYKMQSQNEFFAIADQRSVTISIPEISDDIIVTNELQIKDRLNKQPQETLFNTVPVQHNQ